MTDRNPETENLFELELDRRADLYYFVGQVLRVRERCGEFARCSAFKDEHRESIEIRTFRETGSK
jgi:hypothetical protein